MASENIVTMFSAVGAACTAVGMQNTHSGNMSVRVDFPDGTKGMYITKSGSMSGHITADSICRVSLDSDEAAIEGASRETPIHRKVLSYAKAVIHAHPIYATVLSYGRDTIKPMDLTGASVLRSVPVLDFEPPVDNPEAVRAIPEKLEKHKLVMVARHGSFARGSSLEQAFYYTSIVEHSARVVYEAALLGIDIESAAAEVAKLAGRAFLSPQAWVEETVGFAMSADEGGAGDFLLACRDIFYMGLSPFHTGSASVREGRSIFFVPRASRPEGLGGPILKLPLEPHETDPLEVRMHKAIYAAGEKNAVIHTHNSQAVAHAWLAVAGGAGSIIPIDVEGGYWYPAIPVFEPDAAIEEIAEAVNTCRMAVIHGDGVWSADTSLRHSLHHNSSIRNVCSYKTALHVLNRFGAGPGVESFEKQGNKDGRLA